MAALLTAITSARVTADENPIVDFFGKLFRNERPLDFIDRHAPLAPIDLTRSLQQARKLATEGKWPAVVETLQFLIDRPEDSLVNVRGDWRSLKREAEQMLRALPEDGRRAYLNTFEKLAADQLAAARSRHDVPGLCAVANRFWNTPAGQTAADEICTLLVDAGDLEGAAVWLSQLEEDNWPLTQEANWRLKAASVWKQLGQSDRAEKLLTNADASVIEQEQAALHLDTVIPPANAAEASPDWTMLFGGPTRSGMSSGDRPQLLEQWSVPLGKDPAAMQMVDDLRSELADASQVVFPVLQPVVVGNRVAMRTLNGVEVRELTSGRLLWTNTERFRAEQFLTGAVGEAMAVGPAFAYRDYDDSPNHPLASLLFRDGAYGQVTSDGSRLFIMEQRLPLLSDEYHIYSASNDREAQAAVRWDHSVNALSAYDLDSGRRLWSVGGPISDEPFAPPLTGIYFFGPPTPDGRELFVIGAADNDINLYCLDAATGQPLWQHLIAQYDNTDIADDVARQMWSCPPTVTRGLVICPTNAGWLTAIDRLRHRIVWSFRYSTSQTRERYEPHYSILDFDSRWAPSAPIIASGIVLFTPPELPDEMLETDAHLYGLDVVTGKKRWPARPKGQALALGGVFGDVVIRIEARQISAQSLSKRGQTLWTRSYPENRTPCGQGAAAGGVYWLPFAEGAVMGFRIADGEIEADLKSTEAHGKLGNLVFHSDRLLSASAEGLTCYWQQAPLESLLARRLTERPGDLEARLLAARREASAERWEAALAELDLADAKAETSPELTQQALDLRWRCLTALVAAEPNAREEEFQQLGRLATEPHRARQLTRLSIDRAIARSEWQAAAEHCWSLLNAPPEEDIEDELLTVGASAWVAGRLQDIWQGAPKEIQDNWGPRLESELARLTRSDPNAALEAELQLAFHPSGQRFALAQAEHALKQGDIGRAEIRLRALSSSAVPEIRLLALQRQVELWTQASSMPDARAAALRLQQDSAAAPGDGTEAANWARDWLAAHPPEKDPAHSMDWDLSETRLIRSGLDFRLGALLEVELLGRPAAWLSDRHLQIEPSWEGLACVRSDDGSREWSSSLPTNQEAVGDQVHVALGDGGIVLLGYRGLVHAISSVDGSLLWSHALPPRFAVPANYAWGPERVHREAAAPAHELQSQFRMASSYRRQGILLAISGRYGAILGRRELVVLDLLTGRPRWRRRGISPEASIIADGDAICVSKLVDSPGPKAFRFVDGQEVPAQQLPRQLARAFAISGDRVLTAETPFSLFQKSVRIAAVRLRSGAADWQQTFPADTLFAWGRDRELVAIQPGGEVVSLDLENGSRKGLGTLPESTLQRRPEIRTLGDPTRVYVLVELPGQQDYSYLTLASVTANGELYAFDRTAARRNWNKPVQALNLVVTQFDRMPVLLLAGYRTSERAAGANNKLFVQMVEMRMLDKETGEEVLNWNGAITGGSPSTLSVDPSQRRIDIMSYNERFRIQFPAPASGSQASSK